MGADLSISTKNLSNWVFSFLLTLPEKPLFSMGYDTHDNHLKMILPGQWSITSS